MHEIEAAVEDPSVSRVGEWLTASLARYAEVHQADPARYPRVSRVDVLFSLGGGVASPSVGLGLDTRPGSEPGDGYTHAGLFLLDVPEWAESSYEAIGRELVALLLEARARGEFAKFPKLESCEIGVESAEGEFGWPAYEDRGADNTV